MPPSKPAASACWANRRRRLGGICSCEQCRAKWAALRPHLPREAPPRSRPPAAGTRARSRNPISRSRGSSSSTERSPSTIRVDSHAKNSSSRSSPRSGASDAMSPQLAAFSRVSDGNGDRARRAAWQPSIASTSQRRRQLLQGAQRALQVEAEEPHARADARGRRRACGPARAPAGAAAAARPNRARSSSGGPNTNRDSSVAQSKTESKPGFQYIRSVRRWAKAPKSSVIRGLPGVFSVSVSSACSACTGERSRASPAFRTSPRSAGSRCQERQVVAADRDREHRQLVRVDHVGVLVAPAALEHDEGGQPVDLADRRRQ